MAAHSRQSVYLGSPVARLFCASIFSRSIFDESGESGPSDPNKPCLYRHQLPCGHRCSLGVPKLTVWRTSRPHPPHGLGLEKLYGIFGRRYLSIFDPDPALGRDFHFGRPVSMQSYTQHRARRPNIFGAGLWAGGGVHIKTERAGSDITPEHFSDTSPALRPCNPERGPISTRQTLRSLSAMRFSR